MQALLIAALVLTQVPDRQFDLVCTETSARGRPSEPAYRLRIDLDANRWCEGTCERAREITAVTDDRYTLVDYKSLGRGLRTEQLNFVDRISGEHYESSISRGGLTQISTREGRCERAPFSGMPQPRL